MAAVPHHFDRAQKIAFLKEMLLEMAVTGEPAIALRATEALLNRLEGMPVSRNLNVNADGTDITRVEYAWATDTGSDKANE